MEIYISKVNPGGEDEATKYYYELLTKLNLLTIGWGLASDKININQSKNEIEKALESIPEYKNYKGDRNFQIETNNIYNFINFQKGDIILTPNETKSEVCISKIIDEEAINRNEIALFNECKCDTFTEISFIRKVEILKFSNDSKLLEIVKSYQPTCQKVVDSDNKNKIIEFL